MRMPLLAAAATALITVTSVFTSASAGTAMADQDEQTAYAFIDKERSTLKVDALPLQAAKRLLEIEADIVRTQVGTIQYGEQQPATYRFYCDTSKPGWEHRKCLEAWIWSNGHEYRKVIDHENQSTMYCDSEYEQVFALCLNEYQDGETVLTIKNRKTNHGASWTFSVHNAPAATVNAPVQPQPTGQRPYWEHNEACPTGWSGGGKCETPKH